MSNIKRINASDFKATCLNLMDRLNAGEWDSIEVTKRGKLVAVLSPAEAPPAKKPFNIDDLYGAMRGSVLISPGVDLTAPIWQELMSDEDKALHE